MLSVSLILTQEASYRETKRIMRDMGFNVRIIPKETDMGTFYQKGFSPHTFSEDVIHRLAAQEDISYNHLVATLQRELVLDNMPVIVAGLSGELFPPGRKKPKMIHPIQLKTTHVGYQIAKQLSIQSGDTIQLSGQDFLVARIMPEKSSIDDVRIFTTLVDAQQIFKLEGQINEIKAIDCLCLTADEDPQAILRQELSKIIPEAQTYLVSEIADARAKQRRMVERYTRFLVPLFVLLCSFILAVLISVNTGQRRSEVGLLRALGYKGWPIGFLFLGRSAVLGLVGAVVGYFAGTRIAIWFGVKIFQVTAHNLKTMPVLLLWSILITPVFTAIISFIPAVIAVGQDPALILKPD
jgi:ABC-type lipoprotein release transport system permease subunit